MKIKAGLNSISWMMGVSALILFACSSLRHELFQSTAFDLGINDQATYLISQGKEAFSSILGFHILGDHAAWIWYPLGLLYKIYPSVYWLFIVQALALTLGALPTWYLSIHAGLKESQAIAVAAAYLLHPLVFNANLFDFHAEVIAVPTLLAAVLAARLGNIGWFIICIILVLGCKEVLSLTVVAMGVWLIVLEKRRLSGLIAIIIGVIWFIIATKLIIPAFSDNQPAALTRYNYLGNSVFGIAENIIFHPGLILAKSFSLDNLEYLFLLFAPIIWGISLQGLKPLVGAIPCVALNILADYQAQKDLLHQYSLAALPFLILAVISSLAVGKGWLQKRRTIVIWSLVTFLCFAKFTHFEGKYLESVDNWQATRQAISLVKSQGSVYTTAQIAPHLSNRKLIQFTNYNSIQDIKVFDYILLNVRHPGWASNPEFAKKLVNTIKNNPAFQLKYQKDDVYLFIKQ